MSQLKYCQGPKCHTYDTKDRKKGPKDNKRNETRRRSSFYYLNGNNHLTDERRNITEQQYDNENTITPNGQLNI